MSRMTVRAAIRDYMREQQIPGVKRVDGAPSYLIQGPSWDLGQNFGSGSVGAVHIASEGESRISLPALGGNKVVLYSVDFLLFYQWLIQSAALVPAGEDAWAGPLDITIDGVCKAIRADPNLGHPDVIFQAGQGALPTGSESSDIKIVSGIPRTFNGKVLMFTQVSFYACEVITA